MLELTVRLSLSVINVGNGLTFRRHVGTIPDIMLVSVATVSKIGGWNVREKYIGSNRQYISLTSKKKEDQTNIMPGKDLSRISTS